MNIKTNRLASLFRIWIMCALVMVLSTIAIARGSAAGTIEITQGETYTYKILALEEHKLTKNDSILIYAQAHPSLNFKIESLAPSILTANAANYSHPQLGDLYGLTAQSDVTLRAPDTTPTYYAAWSITPTKPGTFSVTVSLPKDGSYISATYNIKVYCATHQWDSGKKTAPTCTKNGQFLYTCTVCGETKTETIQATGHTASGDYIPNTSGAFTHNKKCKTCGDWALEWQQCASYMTTNTQQATCDKDGVSTTACSRCGHVKSSNTIPALGHDFKASSVSDATCTTPTIQHYQCTRCTATDKREIGTALGHQYKYTKSTDEKHIKECVRCQEYKAEAHEKQTVGFQSATCTAPGSITFQCPLCLETFQQIDPSVPPLGHDYSVLTNTIAPKCTENGFEVFACTRCGVTQQKVINALGHSYSNSCDETCNTCNTKRTVTHDFSTKYTTDGTYHWHKCTKCTATDTKIKHTPSGWIIDKEATATSAGSKHTQCTVCKRTLKTETIPATACTHAASSTLANVKSATCTEPGYTGDVICQYCATVLTPGTEVAMTEHILEVVAAKPATCTAPGYTGDKTCTLCLQVIETGDVIPTIMHTFQDGWCIECGMEEPESPSVPTAPSTMPTSSVNPNTQPNTPNTPSNPSSQHPTKPSQTEPQQNSKSEFPMWIIGILLGALMGGVIVFVVIKIQSNRRLSAPQDDDDWDDDDDDDDEE